MPVGINATLSSSAASIASPSSSTTITATMTDSPSFTDVGCGSRFLPVLVDHHHRDRRQRVDVLHLDRDRGSLHSNSPPFQNARSASQSPRHGFRRSHPWAMVITIACVALVKVGANPNVTAGVVMAGIHSWRTSGSSSCRVSIAEPSSTCAGSALRVTLIVRPPPWDRPSSSVSHVGLGLVVLDSRVLGLVRHPGIGVRPILVVQEVTNVTSGTQNST